MCVFDWVSMHFQVVLHACSLHMKKKGIGGLGQQQYYNAQSKQLQWNKSRWKTDMDNKHNVIVGAKLQFGRSEKTAEGGKTEENGKRKGEGRNRGRDWDAGQIHFQTC